MSDRSSYIGGSDAASVLGLNQYKPVYDVWRAKTGQTIDVFEGKHIKRGNYMEPLIEGIVTRDYDPTLNSIDNRIKYDGRLRTLANELPSVDVHQVATRWMRQDGSLDFFVNDRLDRLSHSGQDALKQLQADYQIMLVHPDYPFIGGHPDGIGDDTLWEFKCSAMRNVERIYEDGISDSWFFQVQHYLMITGLKKGKVAVWDYDNWEPYIIEFDADPALHAKMLERYTDFWDDVEAGVPPIALNDFHHGQVSVIDDPELDKLLGEYVEAYHMRYNGKEKQAKAKGKILSVAKGRKTLITENHRASIAEVDKGSYSYVRLTVKEKE